LSEWRAPIHGTPSGFGQSAIRCMSPPHAKPKPNAAPGYCPSQCHDPASNAAHATPQCVSVRCVIQSPCLRRHHATSSQSGAVAPAMAATHANPRASRSPPLAPTSAAAMMAAAKPVA
jgi:hypothetical protein